MLGANKVSFRQGGTAHPGRWGGVGAGRERWLPASGGEVCLTLPTPQHVIYGDPKTLSKQAPSVHEAVEEYLCDKCTGSLEDPLIFWEMTRRLWPRCVKFPLLYPLLLLSSNVTLSSCWKNYMSECVVLIICLHWQIRSSGVLILGASI